MGLQCLTSIFLCTTAIFLWFSHSNSQPIVTAALQEEWLGPEVSCDHSFSHCTSAPSLWEGSYTGCSFYLHSYSVFSSSPLMLPAVSLSLAVLWGLCTAGTSKIMLWWSPSKQCLAGSRYLSSAGWQGTAVGRQYAPLCLFRFIPSRDSQGHPSWPEMSNHTLKLAADKPWQGSNPQALRAVACIDALPKGLYLH